MTADSAPDYLAVIADSEAGIAAGSAEQRLPVRLAPGDAERQPSGPVAAYSASAEPPPGPAALDCYLHFGLGLHVVVVALPSVA